MIGALREWARRYGDTPTAIDWDRSSAYRHGGAAQVARLGRFRCASAVPAQARMTVSGCLAGSTRATPSNRPYADLPAGCVTVLA